MGEARASGRTWSPYRRWLAGAVALLVLAGCTPSGSSDWSDDAHVPVGSSAGTMTVGGTTRAFRLYRPASLPPGPVPLVLMIHGGGGTAQQAERSYGWDAEADRAGFVVAYPEGLDRSWAVGGGCCGSSGSAGVDDVGFVTALVDSLRRRLPIDPGRIHAAGISEGGLLSYRLACQTSFLAAIGPDSATQLGPCAPPRSVSVIHLHGTADTRIPYDGRPGSGVYHITGPPIPALIDQWRAVDGCAPPSTSVVGPVTTATSACAGGRAVALITIAGAGHQWPGAACSVRCESGVADPPSPDVDATSTIARFFAAHPS